MEPIIQRLPLPESDLQRQTAKKKERESGSHCYRCAAIDTVPREGVRRLCWRQQNSMEPHSYSSTGKGKDLESWDGLVRESRPSSTRSSALQNLTARSSSTASMSRASGFT